MKEKFSCIGDVRGLGAMQAIEFVKNNDPSQPDARLVTDLIHACCKEVFYLLSAGTNKNVIRILKSAGYIR